MEVSPLVKQEANKISIVPLEWIQNLIERNKDSELYPWPAYSQGNRLIMANSRDIDTAKIGVQYLWAPWIHIFVR